MSFRIFAISSLASLSFVTAACAGMSHGIMVQDAYARASNKMAGAAFMEIVNHGAEDDRLIEARSDVSKRVQLHTHKEDANGVMKMTHVEEGFAIPAGDTHVLQRGGDHVMFMGLKHELKDGDVISVTLVFEKAGDITVDVPVDMERKAEAHGSHDHSHQSN